jgi:PilZ domain
MDRSSLNPGSADVSAPLDRRQFPRLKCRLAIEIRTKSSRFPIRGETTDVSLSGCYVSTMLPLPAGTEIELRLWVGAAAINCKALIRTSDGGVGIGIQFVDLDTLGMAILGGHLDDLQREVGQVNEPTGVIHPRI